MKTALQQVIESKRNLHILYPYSGMDHYIQMVEIFIEEGIRAGEYIVLIENERIHLLIQQELQKRLGEEKMKHIHFINNFHFYYYTSSYQPAAMEEYLTAIVSPYMEKQQPLRTWAHVEWETMDTPLHVIKDFEKFVDDAISESNFPLVCAYKKENMPNHLQQALYQTHPLIMTENGLVPSELYERARP